jgi:hypothetical protein
MMRVEEKTDMTYVYLVFLDDDAYSVRVFDDPETAEHYLECMYDEDEGHTGFILKRELEQK